MHTRYSHPGAKSLQSSPYQRWLGVYLLRAEDSSVELLAPYRDEFEGQPGAIHPAILAALAEVAVTTLQPGQAGTALAAGLKLEQVAVAAAGNELYAHAQISNDLLTVEIRTNDDRQLVGHAVARLASQSTPIAGLRRHEPSREAPQLIYPI